VQVVGSATLLSFNGRYSRTTWVSWYENDKLFSNFVVVDVWTGTAMLPAQAHWNRCMITVSWCC